MRDWKITDEDFQNFTMKEVPGRSYTEGWFPRQETLDAMKNWLSEEDQMSYEQLAEVCKTCLTAIEWHSLIEWWHDFQSENESNIMEMMIANAGCRIWSSPHPTGSGDADPTKYWQRVHEKSEVPVEV